MVRPSSHPHGELSHYDRKSKIGSQTLQEFGESPTTANRTHEMHRQKINLIEALKRQ
jgi:hypothetical protein